MVQLVLEGDAEDLSKRGAYGLGRIHCIHPETRKGREIVKRATVAVLTKNSDMGPCEIQYILRDLSKYRPSDHMNLSLELIVFTVANFPFISLFDFAL